MTKVLTLSPLPQPTPIQRKKDIFLFYYLCFIQNSLFTGWNEHKIIHCLPGDPLSLISFPRRWQTVSRCSTKIPELLCTGSGWDEAANACTWRTKSHLAFGTWQNGPSWKTLGAFCMRKAKVNDQTGLAKITSLPARQEEFWELAGRTSLPLPLPLFSPSPSPLLLPGQLISMPGPPNGEF